MSTQAAAEFTPADPLARWTNVMLVATLVLLVVAIVSGLMQVELVSRAAGGAITPDEGAANDARQRFIGVLQTLLVVGTAVPFLMWLYRCHRNLPGLGGRNLKFKSGWAVGGFFVPVLNVVRPVQAVSEVWHGSDPSGLERDLAPDGPAARNKLGTPALVGWWWALTLIGAGLAHLATRMSFSSGHSFGELQTASVLLVLSDVLDVPRALITIGIVNRITNWQAERVELVRRGVMPAPGAGEVPGPIE